MKKYSKISVLITLLGAFLLSCNTANVTQTPLGFKNQTTPTVLPITTDTPTITSTATLIYPTPPASYATLQVAHTTAEALGNFCLGAKEIYTPEISPNGKWIAANCFWENGTEESPLQASSIDGLKNWKIYLSDYKEIGSYFHLDSIIPYHWSQDGKFLYAIVGQRFSGCCWKGLRFTLLIRLNLETGEHIEILNTGSNTGYIFDFVISDDDRYITFTPPQGQSYDFAVLDLATWKTKEFKIEFSETLDIFYSVLSPRADKIVLPLFENIDFNDHDYFINSIGLVDLTTGKQEVLISGLTQERELYPVRWLDDSHVLLSNTDPKLNQDSQSAVKYWLLNIVTREMEKQDNP